MCWRRKGCAAGASRAATAMTRGTTAAKTERSYKRALREEGHFHGTRYREGVVQGYGRTGGGQVRAELRSAHSGRNVGVVRREGARRLRGARKCVRIDQARCCCAQRRQRWRRGVQALSLRSAVPAIEVADRRIWLLRAGAERTQCGRRRSRRGRIESAPPPREVA